MSTKVPIAFVQQTAFNGAAIGVANGINTVKSLVVATPGTGYRQGDILTVSGGTAATAAKLRVEAFDPVGGIVVVSVIVPGVYTANPTNPVAVTGGNGTGATFTLTFSNNAPPGNATWAELTAEGGDVRWRDDGIAPTATVGELLKQLGGTGNNSETEPFRYTGPLNKLQVIGVSAGSILNVSLYGTHAKQ